MQVFMPYPQLKVSVSCLDNRRLGNQVYREGLTLIRGFWPNHPCSTIWRNHKHALAKYCLFGLEELERRGKNYPKWFDYFNNCLKEFPDNGLPAIIGDEKFHLSHKSNLIRKNPAHYRPIFGMDIPNDIPYYWSKSNSQQHLP